MIDYAYPFKKKWLYSFKRKEMILEAIITSLVGVGLAFILAAGI